MMNPVFKMAFTMNPAFKLFGIMSEHDSPRRSLNPDEKIDLQVINFGLSHTGTATVSAALDILGYGPAHQGVELLRDPHRNRKFTEILEQVNTGRALTGPELSARIRDLMSGYRQACDHPVNQLVPEVLAAYPNAKYILSTREGGRDAWWNAFAATLGIHWRDDWSYRMFRLLIWPVSFMRQTDDLAQAEGERMRQKYGTLGPDLYDLHMDDVEGRVPKKQLLLYNVKQGWEPLCRFLDCQVPDQPFPSIDEEATNKAIYHGMRFYGAFVWMCYTGAAASLLFCVARPGATKDLFSKALHVASDITSKVTTLQ